MNREKILEKSKNEKAVVGEAEKKGLNKSNWIALITAGLLAVVLIIIEGLLGHTSAIYAIAAVCYTWASVFYFCQYFVAKRHWPVLIGAILHGAAAITMIVLYILLYTKVI